MSKDMKHTAGKPKGPMGGMGGPGGIAPGEKPKDFKKLSWEI